MFEILDHGSVIVLAENTAGTSALFYSFDEGDSWNAYSFYSATTMLGRWQTSTGGAVFECYPVYVRARLQSPNGPGFQLTCSGLFTNIVRVSSQVNCAGAHASCFCCSYTLFHHTRT